MKFCQELLAQVFDDHKSSHTDQRMIKPYSGWFLLNWGRSLTDAGFSFGQRRGS
jgi:hypothetical protein